MKREQLTMSNGTMIDHEASLRDTYESLKLRQPGYFGGGRTLLTENEIVALREFFAAEREDQAEPTINVPGVTVTVTRSTIDGARLLFVDTQQGVGRVRIDLNDGTIWDGDPEEDQAHWLDGFTFEVTVAGAAILTCGSCSERVGWPTRGDTLRSLVADAKLHNCEAAA